MTAKPVILGTPSAVCTKSHVATLETSCLDVSVEHTGITTLALETLQAIWTKADKLFDSKGHVMQASWLSDKARYVKSTSSDKPHLVKVNSKSPQQYTAVTIAVLCTRVSPFAHTQSQPLKQMVTCGPL